MDPIFIVMLVVIVICGGYAAYKGDARAAGVGVLGLAILALMGAA